MQSRALRRDDKGERQRAESYRPELINVVDYKAHPELSPP
jgi:hypothetical protein